jgi:hypothetical protein
MAEMATYIGVVPRTVTANAAAARGIRLTLNSSGTCDAAGITDAGDYVSLQAIEAAKTGAAVSMHGGGKIPAVASEAVAVGDPAYTAASGKFSKTSGSSAVLVGKWALAASGVDVLGEIELGV